MKRADNVDKHVGDNIRALRLVRNISQTKLAESLGVTFQQVQKYEKGTNRVGAGRLTKIADALDVPVSRLFEGALSAASNGAPADDPLQQLGRTRDGIALARAFNNVTIPGLRKAIVEIAEAAALATEKQQHKKAA
jgi:transcriptional regulator with XRE-family HTH domain